MSGLTAQGVGGHPQVLHEFYVQSTHKKKRGPYALAPAAAVAEIRLIAAAAAVLPITGAVALRASTGCGTKTRSTRPT